MDIAQDLGPALLLGPMLPVSGRLAIYETGCRRYAEHPID